jgi:hypothetical protein
MQPHLEYTDLTIPLGIRITPVRTRAYEGQWHATAAIEADPIIRKYVAEARQVGWESELSTDFLPLVTQGRVHYVAKYGAITAEWKYTDYISVTITLQRVVS